MPMTKADKAEIKEMFGEGINHLRELQEQHYKLFDEKLNRLSEKSDQIDAKVTKTNGTVLKHTEQIFALEKNLPHTIEQCPQSATIKDLYENRITNKAMRKMIFSVITLTGIITTIIVSIVSFLESH